MATERNVVDFKIHNLTEEQFQELKAQGQIDPNAVYCTPDTTKERLDTLETKTTSLEENKQDKGDYATKQELTSSINNVDSNAVHKTGDETIAGTKTFTGRYLQMNNAVDGGGSGLNITDSQGKGQSQLLSYYTGNTYYSRLVCRNNTANKYAYIEVTITDNGEARFSTANLTHMFAPTPDSASNNNDTATTAWVKNYGMGAPDWTKKTTITSGFTATSHGYIFASVWTDAGLHVAVCIINGVNILYNQDNHYGGRGQVSVPVKKGDVFTFAGAAEDVFFVPCKTN